MEKDNRTYTQILRAAKAEFAEKGLSGGRMEAIARRAGVNQALLYYYFNSKENLFNEVLNRVFSCYSMTDLTGYAGRYDLTPSQHLYSALYFILMTHIEETDSEIDKMILRAFELEGEKSSMVLFMERDVIPLFKNVAEIIFAGITTGEFECDDPYLVVMNIFYFIGFYGNDRLKLVDTTLYDHIYGNDYRNRALSYLMGSVFKILRPGSAEFLIPVLPSRAKDELDRMIREFSLQWHRDWNEEIQPVPCEVNE